MHADGVKESSTADSGAALMPRAAAVRGAESAEISSFNPPQCTPPPQHLFIALQPVGNRNREGWFGRKFACATTLPWAAFPLLAPPHYALRMLPLLYIILQQFYSASLCGHIVRTGEPDSRSKRPMCVVRLCVMCAHASVTQSAVMYDCIPKLTSKWVHAP